MGLAPSTVGGNGRFLKFRNSALEVLQINGSARQSVGVRIVRGLRESDNSVSVAAKRCALSSRSFMSRYTAATAEQSFDLAVDGFQHTHCYLRPAVVEDALEMGRQRAGY